eukprot:scaffold33787_cov71-Phaeocystis_antarctica.AAC.7
MNHRAAIRFAPPGTVLAPLQNSTCTIYSSTSIAHWPCDAAPAHLASRRPRPSPRVVLLQCPLRTRYRVATACAAPTYTPRPRRSKPVPRRVGPGASAHEGRVDDAVGGLDGVERGHVLGRQRAGGSLEHVVGVRLGAALGRDGHTMREVPPEEHAGRAEAARLGDTHDDLVLQQPRLAVAEGRVRLQHDALRRAELEQLALLAERVPLDLVDRGRRARAERQQRLQRGHGAVAHAERAALARLARRLHRAPHLAQRAVLDRLVGPVQQQQVAPLHAQPAQATHHGGPHRGRGARRRAARLARHLADEVLPVALQPGAHRRLVVVRGRRVHRREASTQHRAQGRPLELHRAWMREGGPR